MQIVVVPAFVYDGCGELIYNYYRDGYDPFVGRYTQSDPVGLRGGINTYGYVGGNPIARMDPAGLLFCDDWKWMALDWGLGFGSRDRTYSDHSDQVAGVKNLPAVDWARQRYAQKNQQAKSNGCCDPSKLQAVTDVGSKFGIPEFIQATTRGSCAWHFIGSFDVEVFPVSCDRARFVIKNNSSFRSFSYGIGPAWEGGPMGNLRQTYTWEENL